MASLDDKATDEWVAKQASTLSAMLDVGVDSWDDAEQELLRAKSTETTDWDALLNQEEPEDFDKQPDPIKEAPAKKTPDTTAKRKTHTKSPGSGSRKWNSSTKRTPLSKVDVSLLDPPPIVEKNKSSPIRTVKKTAPVKKAVSKPILKRGMSTPRGVKTPRTARSASSKSLPGGSGVAGDTKPLEDMITSLRKELAASNERIIDIDKEKVELTMKLNSATAELESTQAALAKNTSALEQASQKNADYEAQLTELNKSRKKSERDAMSAESALLKQQHALEAELADLSTHLESTTKTLEAKKKAMRKQAKTHEEALAALQADMDQKVADAAAIAAEVEADKQHTKHIIETLQSQLEVQAATIQEQKDGLVNARAEKAALEQRVKSTHKDYNLKEEEYSKHLTTLESQLMELTSQVSELGEERGQMMAEIERLRDQKSASESHASDLTESIGSMQQVIDNLKQDLERSEFATQEASTHAARREEELTNSIEELQHKTASLEENHAAVVQEWEQRYKEEHTKAEQLAYDSQQAARAASKTESHLTLKLEEARIDNEGAQRRITDLQISSQEVEQKLAERDEEIRRMQIEIETLEHAGLEQSADAQQFQEGARRMKESYEATISGLKSAVERERASYDKLLTEARRKDDQLSSLRNELLELETKLSKETKELAHKHKVTAGTQKDQIRQLTYDLEESRRELFQTQKKLERANENYETLEKMTSQSLKSISQQADNERQSNLQQVTKFRQEVRDAEVRARDLERELDRVKSTKDQLEYEVREAKQAVEHERLLASKREAMLMEEVDVLKKQVKTASQKTQETIDVALQRTKTMLLTPDPDLPPIAMNDDRGQCNRQCEETCQIM